ACASFEEACESAILLGDRRIEINAHLGFGRALRLKPDLGRAKSELVQALEQARALALRPQIDRALGELARVEIASGDNFSASRIKLVQQRLKGEALAERAALIGAVAAATKVEAEANVDEALRDLIHALKFGFLRI